MISLETDCITELVKGKYKQSFAEISTTSYIMAQQKYKNARGSLKGEMTKLEHRLVEADMDLRKFKEVGIILHDNNALVVRLETYQEVLQRKTTLCNDKLRQLNSTMENVASKEQFWTISYLQTEYGQLEVEYENHFKGFLEFCM